MELLEEFKIYESMWNDTSTLLESDGDVSSWLEDAGFEGSGKNSYASLQGKNDHRLYVKVGNGSPEEVSFQVDGNRTVINYQDLLSYYGKVFKLSQTGINLIASNFLNASTKNIITAEAAYANPFKAFLLILNSLSAAKGLIYPMALQSDGSLTKTMRPAANSLVALLEQRLQQTNKNLRIDIETVSISCSDNTKLFPLSYDITLKVSDNRVYDKSTFIDYSRTVKDHKLLNYILFELAGLNENERRKFYTTNLDASLDKPLDDVLEFFNTSKAAEKDERANEPDASKKATKTPAEKAAEKKADKKADKKTDNKRSSTETEATADEETATDGTDESEVGTEVSNDPRAEENEETKSSDSSNSDTHRESLNNIKEFLLDNFSIEQNKGVINRACNVLTRALEIVDKHEKGNY